MDRPAVAVLTVDYLALTRDCATQNQFNRVHINLENILTPLEFAELAKQADAGMLPDQGVAWLKRWRAFSPALDTAPEPYLREKVAKNMMWLRPKRAAGAKRRVLIAFGGNADRLMLPLAVFLQALPAGDWDILKLSRCSFLRTGAEETLLDGIVKSFRSAYSGERHRAYIRPGCERGDLRSLARTVRSAIRGIPRDEITCLGTSSGGRPAILVSLRLGLQHCATIGGQLTDAIIPMLPGLVGSPPKGGTKFVHAFAGDNESDRANAARLVELFGGQLVAFKGVKGHATLPEITGKGHLNAALGGLLYRRPFPPEVAEYVC